MAGQGNGSPGSSVAEPQYIIRRHNPAQDVDHVELVLLGNRHPYAVQVEKAVVDQPLEPRVIGDRWRRQGAAFFVPIYRRRERPAKAVDLVFSSRRVEGPEALALGLVSRVVPLEQLMDEAQGYIRDLAKTSSPASLMFMKRQVYRHLMVPLGEAMEETNALQDETVALPDFKEGIASFMERRPPDFPRVTVG